MIFRDQENLPGFIISGNSIRYAYRRLELEKILKEERANHQLKEDGMSNC